MRVNCEAIEVVSLGRTPLEAGVDRREGSALSQEPEEQCEVGKGQGRQTDVKGQPCHRNQRYSVRLVRGWADRQT